MWAQDYIITSQSEINTKNVASANDSVWKYLQTDKYKTNINYEVLNAILTAADAITQLSVALGVTVAIAAYIISYRPTAVYRIDDSYSYIYDPLYWRIDSKIYKNSDFTGLIDSFTSYIQWNS